MTVCIAATAVCLAEQSATAVRLAQSPAPLWPGAAAVSPVTTVAPVWQTREEPTRNPPLTAGSNTSAKLGVEKPSKRQSSMASPRELFPPTKQLTDAELALAARRSRLRREAADAEMKASAAEGVRERFTAPARQTTASGAGSAVTSSATKRSAARNDKRLTAADESDAAIIGESTLIEACSSLSSGDQGVSYLSADAETFFPSPILGPDDSFEPPSWFFKAVRGICQVKTQTPTKPPFMFEEGEQAASHNAALLR